jgi:hypothetical protein
MVARLLKAPDDKWVDARGDAGGVGEVHELNGCETSGRESCSTGAFVLCDSIVFMLPMQRRW